MAVQDLIFLTEVSKYGLKSDVLSSGR